MSAVCCSYRWYTPRSKNPIWRRKTRSMQLQAVSCYLWLTSYLEFYGTVTTFQLVYPCFRGRSVQWCCRRSYWKSRYTGNRYGGAQIGSKTILQSWNRVTGHQVIGLRGQCLRLGRVGSNLLRVQSSDPVLLPGS